MAGEHSKTDQEQKQVRQEDPFVGVMRIEAFEARAFVEARTQKLLERDNAEADESGSKRMTMEDGDAGECGGEGRKSISTERSCALRWAMLTATLRSPLAE
jgi:hypothetical protein